MLLRLGPLLACALPLALGAPLLIACGDKKKTASRQRKPPKRRITRRPMKPGRPMTKPPRPKAKPRPQPAKVSTRWGRPIGTLRWMQKHGAARTSLERVRDLVPSPLDKEIQSVVKSGWKTARPQLRALLTRHRALLRAAANSPRCAAHAAPGRDAIPDEPAFPAFEVKLAQLARLLLLQARAEVFDKRPAEGLRIAVSVLRIACHVSGRVSVAQRETAANIRRTALLVLRAILAANPPTGAACQTIRAAIAKLVERLRPAGELVGVVRAELTVALRQLGRRVLQTNPMGTAARVRVVQVARALLKAEQHDVQTYLKALTAALAFPPPGGERQWAALEALRAKLVKAGAKVKIGAVLGQLARPGTTPMRVSKDLVASVLSTNLSGWSQFAAWARSELSSRRQLQAVAQQLGQKCGGAGADKAKPKPAPRPGMPVPVMAPQMGR